VTDQPHDNPWADPGWAEPAVAQPASSTPPPPQPQNAPPEPPPPGWWLASDGNWYPPPNPWAPPAGQPQYPYPATAGAYGYQIGPATRANGMATASFVLGLAGIPLFWLLAVPSLLAVIFGFIARSQIRRSSGTQTGNGFAIAGIVCGFVMIGCFALLMAVSAATTST
jgi:Domain of unknown function (DUF4190)